MASFIVVDVTPEKVNTLLRLFHHAGLSSFVFTNYLPLTRAHCGVTNTAALRHSLNTQLVTTLRHYFLPVRHKPRATFFVNKFNYITRPVWRGHTHKISLPSLNLLNLTENNEESYPLTDRTVFIIGPYTEHRKM